MKLLEVMNEFSKIAGYKINAPSQLFLYTSSEQYEQEIKKKQFHLQ